MILGARTALAKWLALEKRFSGTTQSRIMELRGRLQSLSKKSLSVSEYLLRPKSIVDHLASTGEIIPELELVLYILNGLGPRYLTFVTSINMT